jgi:hypothetical protein
MLHRKIIRARSDARRRDRYLAGNPLWPLEELYDLRNPPFVADPEFTPFDIHALGCDPKSAPASPSDPTQVRPSKHRHLYTVRREFPIPQLVAGLPWRFAQHIRRSVVPEAEFAPLDLSYISRQWIREPQVISPYPQASFKGGSPGMPSSIGPPGFFHRSIRRYQQSESRFGGVWNPNRPQSKQGSFCPFDI